jgi:hypothetical protein
MRSEPGAGISERWMASAAPFSNRREMRVLKAFRRKPMTIRFMTRKMIVPRRIVQVGRRGLVELEPFSEDQPGMPEKF